MKSISKTCIITVLFIAMSVIDVTVAQEFENGSIGATLNSYGRVRIHAPAITADYQIDRFSLIVGVDETQVFEYKNDAETVDTSRNIDPAQFGDYQLYVAINNEYSGLPPAFKAEINVYGFEDIAGFFVHYHVTNISDGTYESIPGFEILPQIDGAYGLETIAHIAESDIVNIFKGTASTNVGIKLLSENLVTLTATDYVEGYTDDESNLWNWVSSGSIAESFESGADGSVGVMGGATRTVESNNALDIYVAVAVGENQDAMVAEMEKVETKYNEMITDVESDVTNLPQDYDLHQNFPNPFNPVTTIQFAIPKTSDVSLKVYDVLGNEVANLLDQGIAAGTHSVKFDAGSIPSGIYFYTLQSEYFSSTKKMIVLK